MPAYDYECTICRHAFEVFQSMFDEPLKECPKCGKPVKRIITGGSGIIFRGSGFYVTDNKKSAAMVSDTKKTEAKSTESAPVKESAKPAAVKE